jgi:hypothetical protein
MRISPVLGVYPRICCNIDDRIIIKKKEAKPKGNEISLNRINQPILFFCFDLNLWRRVIDIIIVTIIAN